MTFLTLKELKEPYAPEPFSCHCGITTPCEYSRDEWREAINHSISTSCNWKLFFMSVCRICLSNQLLAGINGSQGSCDLIIAETSGSYYSYRSTKYPRPRSLGCIHLISFIQELSKSPRPIIFLDVSMSPCLKVTITQQRHNLWPNWLELRGPMALFF